MVSSAIVFGLILLALALNACGDMLQPMAIAAIGGLLMETYQRCFLCHASTLPSRKAGGIIAKILC